MYSSLRGLGLSLIAIFSAMFLSPQGVVAQVFKYTDESGQVFYVDQLEKVPKQYREQASGDSLPGISKVPSAKRAGYYDQDLSSPTPAATSRKSVEIFVTEWCPYCKQLESFLQEKRISYKRYDIERDKVGKKLHSELGGGGVPVVRIGSKVLRGFTPEAILAALGKK